MEPKKRLKQWIKHQYKGQLIRRTDEPYFDHLIFVAKVVKKMIPLGFEIGLCHDLLEDTDIKETELERALRTFGYAASDAALITRCVVELTDVFTRKAYPHLSKSIRKDKEADRLSTISPAAQTVKYADLLYNIEWVLTFDRKAASSYLQKKEALLMKMDKGDHKLWKQTLKVIKKAMKGLEDEL